MLPPLCPSHSYSLWGKDIYIKRLLIIPNCNVADYIFLTTIWRNQLPCLSYMYPQYLSPYKANITLQQLSQDFCFIIICHNTQTREIRLTLSGVVVGMNVLYRMWMYIIFYILPDKQKNGLWFLPWCDEALNVDILNIFGKTRVLF